MHGLEFQFWSLTPCLMLPGTRFCLERCKAPLGAERFSAQQNWTRASRVRSVLREGSCPGWCSLPAERHSRASPGGKGGHMASASWNFASSMGFVPPWAFFSFGNAREGIETLNLLGNAGILFPGMLRFVSVCVLKTHVNSVTSTSFLVALVSYVDDFIKMAHYLVKNITEWCWCVERLRCLVICRVWFYKINWHPRMESSCCISPCIIKWRSVKIGVCIPAMRVCLYFKWTQKSPIILVFWAYDGLLYEKWNISYCLLLWQPKITNYPPVRPEGICCDQHICGKLHVLMPVLN